MSNPLQGVTGIQTKREIQKEILQLMQDHEATENALREATNAKLSPVTIKVLTEIRDKAEKRLNETLDTRMYPVFATQYR